MRPILVPVLLSLLPLNASAPPGIAGLDERLDAKVAEYTLSANSLADALLRIAKEFQLPTGIEWVKDSESLHTVKLTWKDNTVREILSTVVRHYPDYAFQVEGGVVHVFRRDILNDSRNFLNLKVPDFFEVRQEAAGFANVQLRSVIQNVVSPRDLPPGAGEAGSYASGNIREKPLTIPLRGATVREALEKFAAVSEHNVWIVTFSATPELTPTGFRRTATLWHPAPFPNTQQPMWDLIAWGEYQTDSSAH